MNFVRRFLLLLLAFSAVVLLSSFDTQHNYSGKIISYSKSDLAAGVWEEVTVRVQNTGELAVLRVEAVKMPAEWEISPESLQKQVKTGASEAFTFRIKAPSMTQPATVYWGVAAVYGGFLGFWQKEQRLDTQTQTVNAPRIVVEPEKFDFGEVYKEKVSHDFTVKNVGYTDLKIRSIRTSCGCTTAVLKSPDGEPIEVSRTRTRKPDQFIRRLAWNESATLTVTYDPSHHSSDQHSSGGAHSHTIWHESSTRGKLTRTVYIKSDDPEIPEAEIVVTVDQQ